MREQKYPLPPRKWYSLEQASEKLTNELGEKITEKDIIYYANQGYLELSVYIDFEKVDDEEYKLEIRNSNLNDNVLDEAYFVDIHCWHKYPQVGFVSGKLFKAIVNDPIDMKKIHQEIKDECDRSSFGLVNDLSLIEKIDKLIPISNNVIINNTDGLNLKINIEKLKGFFAIDLIDFDDILIDEENPVLNTDSLVFRPSRNENIESGFAFNITALSFFRKSLIEINKKSIFITLEEIENLKSANKKIRSLNSFESYIDEWKQPTRIIKPKTVKQENVILETDTLKMFTLETVPASNNLDISEINTSQNEQKIIEKTVDSIENLEPKEPIQYEKEYTKKLVIESCLATKKDYPTAGKNTIVKAVISKISNDSKIKGLKIQSERTYTNILDEMGIKFPDEKGKTIEISKVTIVKP